MESMGSKTVAIKEKLSPILDFVIKLSKIVRSTLLFIFILFLQVGVLLTLIWILLKFNLPIDWAFVTLTLSGLLIMWIGLLKTVPEVLAEKSIIKKRKSTRKLIFTTILSIIWTWFFVISMFAQIYSIYGNVEDIKSFKLEITPLENSPPENQTWAFKLEPEITYFKYLYFSSVVITTLGDPDFTPKGTAKIIASIEALTGVLLFGLSVAMLFFMINQYVLIKKEEIIENKTKE